LAMTSSQPKSKALLGAKATSAIQGNSANEIARRTIARRAVEAVIWGMPAVNFDLMYQAMVRETKGVWNQIVFWSRLPDWKNQTLTPNPDSYLPDTVLQH
jgi:hypothetical protein